jgi:hypothetical protein
MQAKPIRRVETLAMTAALAVSGQGMNRDEHDAEHADHRRIDMRRLHSRDARLNTDGC